MQENLYIQIPTIWYIANKNKERLSNKYNEKALVLLSHMLQTINLRNQYTINHYHLQEWFNLSKPSRTNDLFKILYSFEQDKIIAFSQNYNLPTVYKGNIYFDKGDTLTQNNYFTIYDYEFNRIITHQGNEDNHKLYNLFCCIKSHYNTETKICYPTIEQMSNETKLSEKIILKYIDILSSELELILYDNAGTRKTSDGNIKECENTYTMNYTGNDIKLQEHIDRYRERLIQNNYYQEKHKYGNRKRSIKMKLRHLENKLMDNKITEKEYTLTKDKLESEYNQIINNEPKSEWG